MGQHRKQARIKKWRGQWYLFWHDATAVKVDKDGQPVRGSDGMPIIGVSRRTSCAMLGAHTREERSALVEKYRSLEKMAAAEVIKRGGMIAYDTSLLGAVEQYEDDVKLRENVRKESLDGREGLSSGAAVDIRFTMKLFKEWLRNERPNVTTGQVDASLLSKFLSHLATTTGERGRMRSTVTLNKHRGNLRACFGWLDLRNPPLFPNFNRLAPALKKTSVQPSKGTAHSPKELRAFLAAAREYESPDRKVTVERKRSVVALRNGERKPGKWETFEQGRSASAATPISSLFLLLALTGCRRGEALNLRFSDIDFERGRITINARKTGQMRILPLVGAPEGTVAPGLLDLLKKWKAEARGREFVLPHDGMPAPHFSALAWKSVLKLSRVTSTLGPQTLRRSFVSYAASLGIPATVCALWTGHSAAVAERYYRQQVLERFQGDSMEEAMGLTIEV